MKKEMRERILAEADIILQQKMTVRSLAILKGSSKSTIHKDLTERLRQIDEEKYQKIQKLFLEHIQLRHIIGGRRTKEKYEKK